MNVMKKTTWMSGKRFIRKACLVATIATAWAAGDSAKAAVVSPSSNPVISGSYSLDPDFEGKFTNPWVIIKYTLNGSGYGYQFPTVNLANNGGQFSVSLSSNANTNYPIYFGIIGNYVPDAGVAIGFYNTSKPASWEDSFFPDYGYVESTVAFWVENANSYSGALEGLFDKYSLLAPMTVGSGPVSLTLYGFTDPTEIGSAQAEAGTPGTPVPEPSTFFLLIPGIGMAFLLKRNAVIKS
jgi:hypothetical protein